MINGQLLSKGHMEELKELGFDVSDASMYVSGGSSNHGKLIPKTGSGKLHPGSVPIYTIGDLLAKLPYSIEYEGDTYAQLISGCCVMYKTEGKCAKKYLHVSNESTLLMSLFDMLKCLKKEEFIR